MKYPRASGALRRAPDPMLKRACFACMMLLHTIGNLGLSQSGPPPRSNPGSAPANATEAIFRHKTKHEPNNYLDDFLFITLLEAVCNDLEKQFLGICETINFPVSMEKTQWVTQLIVFLGMLEDARHRLILIPIGKKNRALQELQLLVSKRTATVLKLQQITGFFNHLCKAIFRLEPTREPCIVNLLA